MSSNEMALDVSLYLVRLVLSEFLSLVLNFAPFHGIRRPGS